MYIEVNCLLQGSFVINAEAVVIFPHWPQDHCCSPYRAPNHPCDRIKSDLISVHPLSDETFTPGAHHGCRSEPRAEKQKILKCQKQIWKWKQDEGLGRKARFERWQSATKTKSTGRMCKIWQQRPDFTLLAWDRKSESAISSSKRVTNSSAGGVTWNQQRKHRLKS